jgi:hypothetical protein
MQKLQQDEQEDQQTMSTLEQLTGALEHIKKEILQLEDKHDTMMKDKAEQEKLSQVESKSYNQGYKDAESFLRKPKDTMSGASPLDKPQGTSDLANETPQEDSMPNDLLEGISNMSDEELTMMLQHHPELAQGVK